MDQEALRHFAASTFDDLSDNGPGIVKPDLRWDAADVLKHRYQPFQQAFHVLAVVKLEIAAIAMGEAEDKILCFMMQLAVLAEVCIAKISLRLSRVVFEGKIAFFLFQTKLLLLFGDIDSYKTI